MHEPPGYSAVRAMLRILEEKGHVRHEQDGVRYVYAPTRRRQDASRSAVRAQSGTGLPAHRATQTSPT